MNKGDLLIGMDGEFGCYQWKGDRALLNQRVCRLQSFNKDLHPKFLFYGLNSYLKVIEDNTGFTTVKHISSRQIASISFPIPSISEQKCIVAILDKASEDIDAVVENAKKNLANVRELFDSYLNSVFAQKGKGWISKSLGEMGTITSSKRILKSEYVESGVPFYRTKEIKQRANGKAINTELFISRDRYNIIKNKFGVPQIGDILITAIGTIGEIFIIEDDGEFYFKDGNVLWLKDFTDINTHFLRYALMSFVQSLNEMAHGSAYSALPIQRLTTHKIFVPHLEEQKVIVKDLDYLTDKTQRLVNIYQEKIAALYDLKQVILQKAFAGELTVRSAKTAQEAAN